MIQRSEDLLTVGLAQIAPVWLNREATLAKIMSYVEKAAGEDCQLVVFGEALLPGYPFWIEQTDGARFNDQKQKELYSHYLDQGVMIGRGDLDPLCALAKQHNIAIYLGCMERAEDRGGHSLYCSMVYINGEGVIGSVHRKLQPTYEERLAWAPGDGHGLRVHNLGAYTLGGLNCWENWMPLSRAALYGQGEDLHVAIWPGGLHNTHDLTRFLAKEGRSFVISCSGVMTAKDFPKDTPYLGDILDGAPDEFSNGGSCISGPDGEWIIEPQVSCETLVTATLDHGRVREERQNFDPAGHYGRPDVTQLVVNRKRQSIVRFEDE